MTVRRLPDSEITVAMQVGCLRCGQSATTPEQKTKWVDNELPDGGFCSIECKEAFFTGDSGEEGSGYQTFLNWV